MAGQGHAGLGARYLAVLRDELSGRGVRCELIGGGIVPRLRVYEPGENSGAAEFDNNVVAVPLGGVWFYCWPWAEPIGPVTRPGQAAQAILTSLRPGDQASAEAGVLSLTARRMLERARRSALPAHAPRAAAGAAGPVPQARAGGPLRAGRAGSNGPRPLVSSMRPGSAGLNPDETWGLR
jgi:hypothetical protein